MRRIDDVDIKIDGLLRLNSATFKKKRLLPSTSKMTDAFCSSMLEIVTQRIIQSSGFESATSQSIRTLNDIFREHLELLGSTMSAYANLNGRTVGTAFDVIDAMEELLITPDSLKEWLIREGKQLAPCWTVQSDPSRLLEGIFFLFDTSLSFF